MYEFVSVKRSENDTTLYNYKCFQRVTILSVLELQVLV